MAPPSLENSVKRMQARLNYRSADPGVLEAMRGLSDHVRASGIEISLLHLVEIRASQLNGCAWCLDMHSKDAREAGETEQRLYLLPAWREAPFFTPRERAALAWTEAVTLVAESHVPDEIYEEARQQFTEKELVDLTLAVIAINGWNRLNVSFRTVVGAYRPGQYETAKSAVPA